MSDHYDVIIVGSGAGGGTLAHRLAPVRQARPGPRARRLAAARDRELGRRGGLRRQPLRLARHAGTTRNGKAVPAAGPLLRRRRHEVLRRRALPAARARLRRAQAPRRDLTGLADRLRRDGALLHARPSSSTRCTAPAARTRPSRRPSAPYPYPPVSHEPRIQRLFDDMAAVGLHPFHSPSRHHARRGSSPASARASGAPPATASRAWCTPSPTPRWSPYGRRCEHDNVDLVRNARGTPARDRRLAAAR